MAVVARMNGWSRTSRTWSSPRAARRTREVEVVRGAGVGHAVAAEGRGVEDDPAAVVEAVAVADRRARPGQAVLPEEHVRPRDAEVGPEVLERLAERLGVVDGGRLGPDQADVVVRMDAHAPSELIVHPERLVEHAVADLLECAAGVPGLDDGRPGSRPDHVDREEVVVDDEHPRGREVVRGDDRVPGGDDLAPETAAGRWARTTVRTFGWRAASSSRRIDRLPPMVAAWAVAKTTRRRSAQMSGDRERDADQDDPDGQDEPVHERTMSWSMTRSAEPLSWWSK